MISSFDVKVIKISAGGIHSACISDCFEVFTWGQACYGQLGHGKIIENMESLFTPMKICLEGKPFLSQDISCGGMHTASIFDGLVYCWGRGDSGQLGIGDGWLHESFDSDASLSNLSLGVPSPTLVNGLSEVKLVAAGAFHTAIVTEKGELFTWGKEDYGMLGIPGTTLLRDGVWRPHHVPKPAENCEGEVHFTFVACGGWHTVAICNLGRVWVCGRGEYGRLGHSSESSAKRLTQLASFNEEVVQVSCGGTHTLFLTKSGTVHSCGRGDWGRLGLGNTETKLSPHLIEKMLPDQAIMIASGGCHSAAVVVDRRS